MTLIELLVAAGLLGVLTTAIFFVFQVGWDSWRKVESQNELLQQLQGLSSRIARGVERTTFDSVSVDAGNDALAFLSPLDDNGAYVVRADGSLEWQSFKVFYHDSISKTVLRRDETLPAGSPFQASPGFIETYDPGTGVQPWSHYRTEGQVVARHITGFQVTLLPDPENSVELELQGFKKRFGDRGDEWNSLRVRIATRNS